MSGALARIVDGSSANSIYWWYLESESLIRKTGDSCNSIAGIPKSVVDGHYRHCNNFLWPVFHDMPERAIHSLNDQNLYRQFNELFAWNISHAEEGFSLNRFFIQDYQLALLPDKLSSDNGRKTNVFWHIPWPQSVECVHLEALIEVAEGLLSTNKLGFHIEEYALNFMNFVRLHLPHYEVDFDLRRITGIRNKLLEGSNSAFTQIIISPLGLDLQFWERNAYESSPAGFDSQIREICSSPFILSVDRADYTKGILQRIAAIDHLFEIQPHLRGKIAFLQVCQPSRIGLPQFDRYWLQTQKSLSELNNRWQKDRWRPLVWIADPVIPSHLAWLYAQAAAMLVSPVRDGLNLTAKEFIACAREDSLLLLSSGAGVWQEVGDLSIAVNASAPVIAAQQIARSLNLPRLEKIQRMDELKKRVQANPLDIWWRRLTNYESQFAETASTYGTDRKGFALSHLDKSVDKVMNVDGRRHS